MGEGQGGSSDATVKAIVEQIGRLAPDQLDQVRKAVLFGSSANLKDLDRSAFIMNRPSSPRGRREGSPKERSPCNRHRAPSPSDGYPMDDAGHGDAPSRQSSRRLKRTSSDTNHPIDALLREKGNNSERYLVVVSFPFLGLEGVDQDSGREQLRAPTPLAFILLEISQDACCYVHITVHS